MNGVQKFDAKIAALLIEEAKRRHQNVFDVNADMRWKMFNVLLKLGKTL